MSTTESTEFGCFDWSAHYDTMPGSEPTLYVTGHCTFPNSGISVKLERVEQGINPPGVLQLQYTISPSKGPTLQVITEKEARYSEDTDVVYTEVQILPDNIQVSVHQAG